MDQFGCYDYTWLQAVYSNGITPFNQSGTSSNFLDEKFSQSLEFVKRLEATNRNYQVTSNDFDLGKVAFRPFTFSDYRTYMPYPWRIKKYSGFEWTCIRMPAGPSGDNRSEMSALMAGNEFKDREKAMCMGFCEVTYNRYRYSKTCIRRYLSSFCIKICKYFTGYNESAE